MRNLIAALFLFVAFQDPQQIKPTPPIADAPPALSISQASAILMLEHQRLEIEPQILALQSRLHTLDGRRASVKETEDAIRAEFARQHPGWHLDGKTF
jgi:hypothetical protein